MTALEGRTRESAPDVRVESPEAERRVHVPQLLLAVLLIGLCALAALVWLTRATARTPVLALAVDISQGEVVDAADLSEAFVVLDGSVEALPADAADTVIGQRALADLPAGTLLIGALLAEDAPLGEGERAVGVRVTPGASPSPGLRSGDRVQVVREVSDLGELGRLVGPNGNPARLMLVPDAEVIDVVELPTSGDLWVSLRVPAQHSSVVAAAASIDAVRLVQLPGSGP